MTDNQVPPQEFNPDEDGITHINAANKGKTKIGKALSNFAHYPFTHPKHGHFLCGEGYWYWLLTGKQFNDLRLVYGYAAKQMGDQYLKENPRDTDFSEEEVEDILEGLRCKLRQHRDLLNMLVNTNLPIVHYNWYGKNGKYKIYTYEGYQWFIDEIERIRKVCQEKWKGQ